MKGMDLIPLSDDAPTLHTTIPEPQEGDALVPLFHHARGEQILVELLHTYNIRSIVDYTPGSGCMLKAALRFKAVVVAVFKNPTHLACVMKEVEEWTIQRMKDCSDERFFVNNTPKTDAAAEEEKGEAE